MRSSRSAPGVAAALLAATHHASATSISNNNNNIWARSNGSDQVAVPLLHNVQLQYCPQSCAFAGADPAGWTTYHSMSELELCTDTPVLFTLGLDADFENTRIKACSTAVGGPEMQGGAFYGLLNNNVTQEPTPELIVAEMDNGQACGVKTTHKADLRVETSWSAPASAGDGVGMAAALDELKKHWASNTAGCGSSVMFARAGKTVVAAFSGGDLANSAAADLIENAAKLGKDASGRLAMQACNVAADVSSPAALKSYVHGLGKCAALEPKLEHGPDSSSVSVTVLGDAPAPANGTNTARWSPGAGAGQVGPRANCRDIQVVSGDSCGSLATKCGITGTQFSSYNSFTANLCSTLMPKQWVCCSTGTLPDHTPQPQADGRCTTVTVAEGDGCWSIGEAFGINATQIETVNKQTFGFAGCARLQRGQVICISKGEPPMPAQDPTALCGPWVLGTQRPADYSEVGQLNPCPINACCDVWGQCGTTSEFCTKSEVDGHPGTAMPNTNGCVSNCGTDIVNGGSKPASFAKVGYFEGFNKKRRCLQMDVTQVDLSAITHIHFAFAGISKDYQVTIESGVKEQFDKMVKMDSKGVKKILSFGGWSFSTDYDTSPIFATSVSAANREKFAASVVKFLKDNSLDGLDFDWEYPGATDIPGSVPGSKDDGQNYLLFLQAVKKQLPSGKTLSIALPASYWYLKGFPVRKMASVVDYFVYMTYDLHGQWDYGSKWSNPGCPGGNCLRSHVNRTETRTALSMVTKAGAKTNQIMLGVSSYGRSFKMKDASCTGPNCQFTGSATKSDAEPGLCTDTGGYISDAEISTIVNTGEDVKTWLDQGTASNIMTWRGNWVAYMDGTQKSARTKWAESLNLAGTSDWAVDLQKFHNAVDGDTSGGENIEGVVVNCNLQFNNIAHLAGFHNSGTIPHSCRAIYMLGALVKDLDTAIAAYKNTDNNYDKKFGYYAEYIEDLVNPQLANWMNNWGTDQETKKGLGNKYFDCKYKRDNKDKYRYEGPCPVPKSIMEDGTWDDPEDGYESWIIEYKLRDKEGFEKALSADLGMMPDWIKWQDWDSYPECEGAPDDCTEVHQWLKGDFPRKADKIEVTDPKDIWEKALPEMQRLRDKFTSAMLSVGLGLYDVKSDPVDAAVALAMPVSMLTQAAQSMADIKEFGSKIEARKKKELILLIVSIVLMVVPFLAEVGFSVAGLAAMARFAFIGGEIANGALSIAEIIDNPESAPFAVMGMLLGAAGRGKSQEEVFGTAAKARKAMDGPAVSGMGKSFKAMDDNVQLALRACPLR
ncbi:hypothetical protein Micbo1qcDRAFT_151809 [Microdochium bolleyi]|uniref:chitinase n=1 Tax=Microdochium bolleyi TaxID=196109 RepID=A0A136ISE7_9PEZI|nr:hypothetical protein Micbo1qcDRAFT_151809 [Microdochium bolleyi]